MVPGQGSTKTKQDNANNTSSTARETTVTISCIMCCFHANAKHLGIARSLWHMNQQPSQLSSISFRRLLSNNHISSIFCVNCCCLHFRHSEYRTILVYVTLAWAFFYFIFEDWLIGNLANVFKLGTISFRCLAEMDFVAWNDDNGNRLDTESLLRTCNHVVWCNFYTIWKALYRANAPQEF